MKKIFKGLAILAAVAAVGVGVGVSAGCAGGKNGVYEGDYHYTNEHGATYGMKVKVTVKNNIITKVEDVTLGAYTTISNAMPAYGWTDEDVKNWNDYESLLLQKYEGWSVADILDLKVFIKETGEPYSKNDNADLLTSDLLIPKATQGSGRVLLAVQNALGKTTEIGRIEKQA